MAKMLLVNPRRRRARKKVTRKRRRNPVRAVRRRAAPVKRRRRVARRSNPSFRAANVKQSLTVAAHGATGAIALDMALAYLPVPAQLKGGMVGRIVKGAGAIALGVVAANFVKASTAQRMAEGALTVQMTGLFKEVIGNFAPGINLGMYESGLGYYGSGFNPEYDNGMGTYLTDISADPMGIDETNLGLYMTGQEQVAPDY